MPRFPKDKRETMSLCYQVLAEDLEILISLLELSGISAQDKEIIEDLRQVSTHTRTKSNKIAMNMIEEEGQRITDELPK